MNTNQNLLYPEKMGILIYFLKSYRLCTCFMTGETSFNIQTLDNKFWLLGFFWSYRKALLFQGPCCLWVGDLDTFEATKFAISGMGHAVKIGLQNFHFLNFTKFLNSKICVY